ncbi:MAG TPA: hypothetical protein VMI52_07135 [Acetobacteraceae bacterium]|nr:hypothetical protein [Acetobacteraceae bacterium]
MRILLSGLVAAGLLTSSFAQAIEPCARPADQTAFNVEGLKSELMVTALSCHAQNKYNAFMARYKGDIAANESALDAYFKRTYGRSAQKAHDDYITQLANVQSEDGLQAGTAFCDTFASMFDEVQALHDGSELPDYASAKDIVQPVSLTSCALNEKPPVHGKSRIHHTRATGGSHKQLRTASR